MVHKSHLISLKPQEYHAQVMDDTKPAVSYNGGDLSKWQSDFKSLLKELLKINLSAERVNLNVRSLFKFQVKPGTVEKIEFASESGCDVVGYVCIPRNASPPYKFMICLQGHTTGMHQSVGVSRNDENRRIRPVDDRDFAIQCMQHGFAALCIEQRSMGKRAEFYQTKINKEGCLHAAMRSLMLGKALIGERVFDVDRAIDYLISRDDVDAGSIGIMGNSGGGTVAIYSAAMLDRISYAMPSCSFCTFKDSIMAICHCACNYIPDIYRYCDMADILGLFAPKPVVIVAGSDDEIFPMSGVKNAYRDLLRIYREAGAEDKCKLVTGPNGHRFYADLAWPVMLELSGAASHNV